MVLFRVHEMYLYFVYQGIMEYGAEKEYDQLIPILSWKLYQIMMLFDFQLQTGMT